MSFNFLLNSLDYLSNIANGNTAETYMNEYTPGMCKWSEQFHDGLVKAAKIEHLVSERVSFPQDELKKYFGCLSGTCSFSPARMLFEQLIVWSDMDIDEAVQFLLNAPNEYIWHSITMLIASETSAFNTDSATYDEFLTFISNPEFGNELTVCALRCFLERHEYIRRIGEMLSTVKGALTDLFDEIEPVYSEYEKRFRSRDFMEEFRSSGLFRSADVQRIEAKISLFSYTTNTLTGTTETNGGFTSGKVTIGGEKEVLHMLVGICSWDHFMMRRFTESGTVNTESISKLLADKTRLDIISYIKDHECYGQELSRVFGLSKNTIYSHMKKLISANLVMVKPFGKNIYYATNPDVIKRFLEQFAKQIVRDEIVWKSSLK